MSPSSPSPDEVGRAIRAAFARAVGEEAVREHEPLVADLIAAATAQQSITCTRCGAEFTIRDEPAVTNDLAEIAGLAGATDFFREVTCPECGATVKVRPPSAGASRL